MIYDAISNFSLHRNHTHTKCVKLKNITTEIKYSLDGLNTNKEITEFSFKANTIEMVQLELYTENKFKSGQSLRNL